MSAPHASRTSALNTSRRILAAVALFALSIVVAMTLAGCGGTSSSSQETQPAQPEAQTPAAPAQGDAATELQIKDTVVGTGAEAKAGDTVTVNYTGWLEDGTKFDSSLDSGQPFQFPLGAGMVIKGWDQGVAGMKVGGKRELIIPPSLGYGAEGAGGVIPPNATLKFEVELLDVAPAGQ